MANGFALESTLKRHPDALSRRLLDGLLVLAPGATDSIQISAPGEAIWAALAQETTVGALIEHLAVGYDVAEQEIRDGVLPVLQVLRDAGALILGSSQSPSDR